MNATQINSGMLAMLNISNYGHILKDPDGCLRLKTTALISADRTFDIMTRSSKFKKVNEMKRLVDILASDLKEWPEGFELIHGYMWVALSMRDYPSQEWRNETVTRAEWQAAVDALNAVKWDGVGLPPVGTICEVLWNESRMEYLRTKVFGVNEHGQPIHRFDEGLKKYQYQADVLRTASGTQVFRPIRTAEQVAAEEREKAIKEMMMHGVDAGDSTIEYSCAALYDAGYRKEPKPCGS